jgi:endoglucanase
MPRLPFRLRGTWVEGAYRNYAKDASASRLLKILDDVIAFSRERNVPVFCGEYGVYIPNSPASDRALWYEFVTNALDRRNISRTSWDYYGGFGIFNSPAKGDFHSDVNTAVVKALGFTPPVQNPKNNIPINEGFVLFDDFPNAAINAGFGGNDDSDFSFYETSSAEGEYAIRWYNAGRYNSFWFGFPRNGDFTVLVAGDYFIEFKCRTQAPVQFDVRFVMEENASSIPWRMRYTIYEGNLPPDGKWHTIRIPLNSMTEQGAWMNASGTWLNPKGEFSWDRINRLEFSAEHMDLYGIYIWFDSIKIVR